MTQTRALEIMLAGNNVFLTGYVILSIANKIWIIFILII
ncbi:MAG: hypothetical protein UY22_C0001G0001, partial [Candidatus Amesbacteria bacterium GW2011_GWC1_48_10]